MSDGGHGWLSGWGAMITGLGTAALAIVGYLGWAHPQGSAGEQSFSVPVQAPNSPSSAAGQKTKNASLDFQVKKCDVGSKLVSCSLSVVSPRYDRRLFIATFGSESGLIDSDGDHYRLGGPGVNLPLERDRSLNFKLSFPVNKDVVRPLTVRMQGYVDNQNFQQSFEIK